jgi:hypothetical protein
VTLFEFLSVAVSIVLALSAGELLTNLREVFASNRRYWVHSLWVAQQIPLHILNWWALWAYRDIVTWNLFTFSLVLIPPGLLYMCTSSLVPRNAAEVTSWRDYFFEARRWFFAARSLFIVTAALRTWYLLDKPLLESPTRASAPMLACCMIGLFSSNRRVQEVVSVTTLVLLIMVSYFRLEAGAR